MFKYCLSLTKRTFKVGDFKETKEKQKKTTTTKCHNHCKKSTKQLLKDPDREKFDSCMKEIFMLITSNMTLSFIFLFFICCK